MERLTDRGYKGRAFMKEPVFDEEQRMFDIVNRLAAYEDTGLEPEEIKELCTDDVTEIAKMFRKMIESGESDHLRELAQADKDGRLVVLPCKMGDTVWTNISIQGDRYRKADRPYPATVVFIGMGEKSTYFHVQYTNGRVFPFDFDQIGKTVFKSREEAET